ncbi:MULTISPECIES: TIGR04376 family protein [Cyanophyceae]|uniref:TIGR04376 family protein n=1 Tax=Cyanophyceae TaxID=3028117 RepID=UPI001687660E|nr:MULTISPECIES: TIGR04376 family protein [Cyanophyceae]MBD1918827.1 TIGR04376 family protein [Phormidium sp. FACHB-77]MBD2033330.1 TIGR04376 family protein [Phormidium sp. FACHB-322]MBD2053737.1 TIGR04376 family protein [Leptolyngbya sp. FACHB-60]
MGLFEDLSKFLEIRLDEFLKANPHLELWGLEDQLRGQEQDAIHLLGDLKRREKQLEDSILATAQDIQRWHSRIQNAQAANRLDLVKAAQEREAALLRQGNQYWGQMKGVKEQIEQTRNLQKEIHDRRRELKAKIAENQAQRTAQRTTTSWDTGWAKIPFENFGRNTMDPVEESFQRWETEQELEELKRNMGR